MSFIAQHRSRVSGELICLILVAERPSILYTAGKSRPIGLFTSFRTHFTFQSAPRSIIHDLSGNRRRSRGRKDGSREIMLTTWSALLNRLCARSSACPTFSAATPHPPVFGHDLSITPFGSVSRWRRLRIKRDALKLHTLHKGIVHHHHGCVCRW